MEKNEFHAVIKHLYMKDLTPKEIKAELDNVHSTSASAFATVYNWVNEFKRGRTATCGALRSGRPIEAIDKVHDIVVTDRRVKVRELVEATGISHGTVISILHEQLDMKKLSARWVRLLTVDHKFDRVTISKQCLEMFQRNSDEFLRQFITVDETWNLVPCDYFLFPNLKKWFGRKRFTREQLIAETEAYFEGTILFGWLEKVRES
ncbi:SETMR methyltransferase, partial [Acromyrmex insinuator]